MSMSTDHLYATTAWRGRPATAEMIAPEDQFAEIVRATVVKLAIAPEHRLTNVTRRVAAELIRREPMLGWLLGEDEIADRVAPHVVQAAERFGRKLQDDRAKAASPATPAKSRASDSSCSDLPPSGQPRSTAEAANADAPDGGHPQASEAGQCLPIAEAAGLAAPAPTPPKDDGGQALGTAHAAKPVAPPVVRPQPAPNRSVRSAASILAASRLLMDSYTLRDGRPIGDVRWGELATLSARSLEEAVVLEAIRARGTPDDPGKRVREILRDADLAVIIAAAKERRA